MVIRCVQCGTTLGQQVAGVLVVTHRRRELVITLPAHVIQRCNNCGALNTMGDLCQCGAAPAGLGLAGTPGSVTP